MDAYSKAELPALMSNEEGGMRETGEAAGHSKEHGTPCATMALKCWCS